MEKNEIKYSSVITEELVLRQLINLKQLTFELTDACNLHCKYCGYGELYSTHDKRENLYLDFPTAKQVIDYLYAIWTKYPGTSSLRKIVFGFYGGEPLLNMTLIQQIVSYLESLPPIPNTCYAYNMTTNALLLDKYKDYLVEKRFQILISLDGDRWGHSYRTDFARNNSFDRVFANVKKLQTDYPEYFEEHISFNSVLHDRNDTHGISEFIFRHFGKYPNVTELNNFGIVRSKAKEFEAMYHHKSSDVKVTDPDFYDKSSDTMNLFRVAKYLSGNGFYNYNSLLKKGFSVFYPSGTCLPFEKKMFITVRGKILPCERIDQKYSLGKVTPDGVELDLKEIAALYSNYYKGLKRLCEKCHLQHVCSQCMFYISKLGESSMMCPNFANQERRNNYLKHYTDILEQRPDLYKKLLNEMLLQS